MTPTHDWHICDGLELVIRRDEADSVGIHLGHEGMDDAHSTTVITSRLLEMIDTVQPGAVCAHLAAQDGPTSLDPHTLTTIAKQMRNTVKDEYPASPQQEGAFTATISWADHLDNLARKADQ